MNKVRTGNGGTMTEGKMTGDTQIWILIGGFSLLLLMLVACGGITARESPAELLLDQAGELVETSSEVVFPLALDNTWVD
ncbi:MAG: hypothetical protein JXA33_24890 [Anaerolineae bacterium]|nr:hypothetical protein [Anaerolineae bacterium]